MNNSDFYSRIERMSIYLSTKWKKGIEITKNLVFNSGYIKIQ